MVNEGLMEGEVVDYLGREEMGYCLFCPTMTTEEK